MKKQIWIPLGFVICCLIGSCQDFYEEDIPTLSSIVVENPFFSLLEAAAIKGEVAVALSDNNPNDEAGRYTLFAPTNQAFERLGVYQNRDLIGIQKDFLNLTLNYHIANGLLEGENFMDSGSIPSLVGPEKKLIIRDQNTYINGSKILFTDVETKNGLFHGIDKILLISDENTWHTAQNFAAGEIFVKPDLLLLEAAVIHAGLEVFISEGRDYTLFAPNDQAFAQIGITSVADIESLPQETMARILANHVVMDGGKFTSEQKEGIKTSLLEKDLEYGPFLQGTFTIKSQGSNQAANMVIPDIKTTNAVVHIIDRVLLP